MLDFPELPFDCDEPEHISELASMFNDGASYNAMVAHLIEKHDWDIDAAEYGVSAFIDNEYNNHMGDIGTYA